MAQTPAQRFGVELAKLVTPAPKARHADVAFEAIQQVGLALAKGMPLATAAEALFAIRTDQFEALPPLPDGTEFDIEEEIRLAPDELLTKEQAAAILGIKPATVGRMLNDGRLNPTRFNSQVVRIRRADLEEFIRASRTKAPPAADRPGDQEAALAAAVLELARTGTLTMKERLRLIENLVR